MLGAVLGDVAGSRFEPIRDNCDRVGGDPWGFELLAENCRPTDDTFMTFAVARALRETDGDLALLGEACVDSMHDFGRRYPGGGYGGRFGNWLMLGSREPYNSFGNGSAMRVSPVGWAFGSLEETLEAARITAAVTHSHPFGIAGAQAVAQAIFMARKGASQGEIREALERAYGYDLSRPLADVKRTAVFDETCQVSVPEALCAFLQAESLEDAVRKAVWLEADTDTQGAIAGSCAEALFGMPADLKEGVLAFLDANLRNEHALWEDWLRSRSA